MRGGKTAELTEISPCIFYYFESPENGKVPKATQTHTRGRIYKSHHTKDNVARDHGFRSDRKNLNLNGKKEKSVSNNKYLIIISMKRSSSLKIYY